jgi:hypothetical protein
MPEVASGWLSRRSSEVLGGAQWTDERLERVGDGGTLTELPSSMGDMGASAFDGFVDFNIGESRVGSEGVRACPEPWLAGC